MNRVSRGLINAMTVDVEDWVQSVFDRELPLTERFRINTEKVLGVFAAHGVRGTFFVLGLAAEKAPELVREIQRAGHEIQSHGYDHRLIHTLSPDEFRRDLIRSKKLLEDITGIEVEGYRAPAFSITAKTLWASDALVECGFRYDSSVFPVKTRRYGIRGAPWFPYRLRTPAGHLIPEIPVATFGRGRRRVPIGGGGYIRALPSWIVNQGVRKLNEAGTPATIYVHPYEFAPDEMAELPHAIPFKMRLHQGLGRKGFARKIERLVKRFRFGPIRDVIASVETWPTHDLRANDKKRSASPQCDPRLTRRNRSAVCNAGQRREMSK